MTKDIALGRIESGLDRVAITGVMARHNARARPASQFLRAVFGVIIDDQHFGDFGPRDEIAHRTCDRVGFVPCRNDDADLEGIEMP